MRYTVQRVVYIVYAQRRVKFTLRINVYSLPISHTDPLARVSGASGREYHAKMACTENNYPPLRDNDHKNLVRNPGIHETIHLHRGLLRTQNLDVVLDTIVIVSHKAKKMGHSMDPNLDMYTSPDIVMMKRRVCAKSLIFQGSQ